MIPITSTPTFSLAYLEAVRDVQYQLVAALTLLVWDFLLTLGGEMEYIWRMRRCMFKWFYFYFRYFLLVEQISHLVALPRLSSGHTTDFLCKIWYLYAVSFVHISVCMIDVILATRVFALFNRSRKVGVFLSGLILIKLAVAGSNIALCSVMEYFEACILPLPRKEMASPIAGITVIAQSIILGMTLFKHFVAVRLGWGRTPLLSLLVRDATSCYVLMFLICGFAMVVCVVDNRRVAGVLYWSTSLYSALGSRLILSMEHYNFVRGSPSDESDEGIVLTSHISL